MGWDIRIWHEGVGESTRLVIEAGGDVPEEVIATVAGSYWEEEVRYSEAWLEEGDFDGQEGGGPGGLHG
ncbi:MAG TPA: hypothetical protein VFB58_08495 [Chloroflexota bacterium]|nr:hypothetical protein [Chloroflexota bacterium]